MQDFIFRVFVEQEEAMAYSEFLSQAGLDCEIRQEAGPLPDYILGGFAAPRYLLLLDEAQCQLAEKLIQEWMQQQVLQEPPTEHPFQDSSEEELQQVLKEGKLWSDYDIAYAKYRLSQIKRQEG
jgi:hypothetical protein